MRLLGVGRVTEMLSPAPNGSFLKEKRASWHQSSEGVSAPVVAGGAGSRGSIIVYIIN